MDGIRAFFEAVKAHGLVAGRLRGLFHIAIGRRIITTDGVIVSNGITWRDLATLLKDLRFDKNLAAEVGADPDELSPRDRQRFWYSVISIAGVNGPQAMKEAEQIIAKVGPLGYVIGPAPSGATEPPKPPPAKKPPKKK